MKKPDSQERMKEFTMEKEQMVAELVRLVGGKRPEVRHALQSLRVRCVADPVEARLHRPSHLDGRGFERRKIRPRERNSRRSPGLRDESQRGERSLDGGIAVVLTRMNRILDMDIENQRVVVQPGIVTLNLKNVLARYGYLYQPDPASEKATTLGGNVGENAGGPHCLKYGVTSNHVLGVEMVLFDGEIVQVGGKALDNPGFDLPGFLGARRGRSASSRR